jgi:hypothetical protein
MAKIKYIVKQGCEGKAINRLEGRFVLNSKLSQAKLRMLYNLGHTDTIEKING